MIKLFLLTIVLILVGGGVKAKAGNIYSCVTKDVQEIGPKGTLVRNKIKVFYKKSFPTFVFDEVSGLLRKGSLDPEKFQLIQKGSYENSSIGLLKYNGIAASGVEVFRIKTWEKEMPFLFLDGYIVFTGNCKRL